MGFKKSIARGIQPNLLITAIVFTAALYFGREVFVPIATAGLLSFLAIPLVERLERRGLGRVSAVLCSVCLGMVVVGGFSFVLARQIYDVAYRLPEYKDNIIARVEFFQGGGDGVIRRVTSTLDEIRARLSTVDQEKQSSGLGDERISALTADQAFKGKSEAHPIPVEISQQPAIDAMAANLIGGAVGPLGSASSVVVLVIFMLLKREDLRNRFISLVGGKRLHITTQALDDGARRISSYLLMQTLVNAIYGLVIFVGLAAIGLPNSLLWGVMAMMLRFVPFIGPLVATAVPLIVSLAAFSGWMQPGLVLLLYVANEVFSGMVVEPWLFGSSTGLSAIGMLVATAFWTWLWGPLGMMLATPLTVCLAVMGRYIPQLEPLNTLLGEDDALPPHSRYYQRLLANDPEEAVEVAEEFLRTNPLDALYENVLVPALSLAERDWRSGGLDNSKRELILRTTREIVEELGERERQNAASIRLNDDASKVASVLCLPARTEADELVGLMLGQLLEQSGVHGEVVSCDVLSGEIIDRIENAGTGVVCVSSLRPARTTYARYLCKRLRRRLPDLRITTGLWTSQAVSKKISDGFAASGSDGVCVSLKAAACELKEAAKRAKPVAAVAAVAMIDGERRCA